ncbi:MAG: hypothetical protein WC683_10060 [bacterium]
MSVKRKRVLSQVRQRRAATKRGRRGGTAKKQRSWMNKLTRRLLGSERDR